MKQKLSWRIAFELPTPTECGASLVELCTNESAQFQAEPNVYPVLGAWMIDSIRIERLADRFQLVIGKQSLPDN